MQRPHLSKIGIFDINVVNIHLKLRRFFSLLFYIVFDSQGHIAMSSLQVEETSTYCTVNHRASASNYQLSNMKGPARDLNRWPQRLEVGTLTSTPPSPPPPPLNCVEIYYIDHNEI